jgi:NAD dependent epimerase/dehydratase family enzyme
VRQGDFARILAAALERPAIVPAPAFAIRAALGEMGRELLLDSVRARSAVLEGAGFEFESPDLAAAFDSMFAG